LSTVDFNVTSVDKGIETDDVRMISFFDCVYDFALALPVVVCCLYRPALPSHYFLQIRPVTDLR